MSLFAIAGYKQISEGLVTMILLLGPSGSGKTTLVKTLLNEQRLAKVKSHSNTEFQEAEELPSVIPTVGTNIISFPVGRKAVEIREVGGCMIPIWKSYFKDAKAIIFVIDASNPSKISSASIELRQILSAEGTQATPLLILFNKTDIPSKTCINEIKYMSHIDHIIKHANQPIICFDVSCKEKVGLSNVIEWIVSKKFFTV